MSIEYVREDAASSTESSDTVVKCISILSKMAGPSGMVYGQQLDLEAENTEIDWDMLQRIHEHKTGCLLTAPLLMASTLANHEEDIPVWKKIGFSLGLAFQVQDDILDIELTAKEFGKSNSDQKNHKGTSVSILGIERAKEVMNDLYQTAIEEIQTLTGFESAELLEYVCQIQQRRK